MVFGLYLSEIVSFGHLSVFIRDYVATIVTRLVYRHPSDLALKSSLTATADIYSAPCCTLFLPRCDRPHLHLLRSGMIMLIQIRS